MSAEGHDHSHVADHSHENGSADSDELQKNNLAELQKAVTHLTKKNQAREWLLAETEKRVPNPVDILGAKLELIVDLITAGDELKSAWVEYQWQARYEAILTQIERMVYEAPRPPAPSPEFLGD